MWRQLRRILRLTLFGFLSLFAVAEFIVCGSWRSLPARRRYHAAWFHKYAALSAALIQLQIKKHGDFSGAKMIVSNHVSYLDVFTICSRHPVIFVSMAEVKHWPWGGILARCAGAIFLEREKKGELLRVSREIADTVAAGVAICLFLEGTTSDGSSVLPFHSSLLQPAVENHWPVVPCCLRYAPAGSDSCRGVAWHDSQPFFEHLWNFLMLDYTRADISAGSLIQRDDRKALTRALHDEVSRMKAEFDAR